MNTEEKHPPEYYAQGLHLTPEQKANRLEDIYERKVIRDEARKRDALPRRPKDTEDITFERAEKAATKDEKGNIIDTGFEDFITDDSKLTKRMLDGSVLDALFSKAEKYPIDGDQYAAGRQLLNDWDLSGAGKISAVDTTRDAVDGGQMKDMTAKAIDAQGRYRCAMKAIGHTHAHVLFYVVLIEERLELYGQKWCYHQSKKLAKVAAKEALRRALTELAIHYGFAKMPKGRFTSHAPDFRPSIAP